MMKTFLPLFFLFCTIQGFSQTVLSINSGNWLTSSSWNTSSYPTSSDSVVIQSGDTIFLEGTLQARAVNILNGGVLMVPAAASGILTITNGLTVAAGGYFLHNGGSSQLNILYVGGNVSISGTLDLNRSKLDVDGNIIGSGNLYCDSIYSQLVFSGSSSQSLNVTIRSNYIANATFSNSVTITGSKTIAYSARFLSGSVTCSGTLTLGLGGTTALDYERADGTHPTITRNYGSGANTFTYSNTTAISTGSELTTTISSGTLIINCTGGVTLSAACSIPRLTMTAGQIFTTSTQILNVTDTAYSAVTRTGGWVRGPMTRMIPYGLNTIDRYRIYLFPVGKTSYAGLEMVTPITRNTTTFSCPTMADMRAYVESFDGATGGNATYFTSLKTNRYWYYTFSGNTCAFYSSGIRVYDSTADNTLAMGAASSKTGTYNNIGGFYYDNTLGGTQPIYAIFSYSNNVYINLGGKPSLSSGTYSVGASRTYKTITEVSNLLHSRILQGDCIFEFYDDYSSASEIIPFFFWPWADNGGNYKVTLRPHSSNSTTLVSEGQPEYPDFHAFNYPLLSLEGTRNLIIDGRKGGSGTTRSWIFRNTGVASIGPVISYQMDAARDTVKYCILEGETVNTGLVDFRNTMYANGNDSNGLVNCLLRRRTDVGGTTFQTGIANAFSTGGPVNDYNYIYGNEIENFTNYGIRIDGNSCGSNWNISSNHLYSSVTTTNNQTIIYFNPSNYNSSQNNRLTDNYIGGSATSASGTYLNSFNGTMTGIRFAADTNSTHVISNNTIRGFRLTGGTNAGFTGIYVPSGKVYITGNTIGNSSSDSSVITTLGTSIYGIYADTNTRSYIGTNTITGLMTRGSSAVTVYGIRHISKNPADIYNNTIYNISHFPSTNSTNTNNIKGIYLATNYFPVGGSIRKNTVYNIYTNDSGAGNSVVRLIDVKPNVGASGEISRNRLYGSMNPATGATPELTGIYLDEGKWTLSNNQVSLNNKNRTNAVTINGLLDFSSNASVTNTYFNSVYIGGSTSSGALNSSCWRRTVTSTQTIRNNIFYNARTGGTGKHICIYNNNSSPTTGWTSSTASQHNLFVSNDTSLIGIRNSTNCGIELWRFYTTGDSTSWAYNTTELPADSLFSDKSYNLNIQNTRKYCFAAHGKGKQISNYSEDFGDSLSGRSTTVVMGAPDIGSDEFSPGAGVKPVTLYVNGSHTNGGTEKFWQGSRQVAEIIWSASGTLPTLSDYLYYTGVWPNDTNNNGHSINKNYTNCYLRIDTSNLSAGSGYSYTLKMFYDDAMLGKISNENLTILTKRKTDVVGTWDSISKGNRDTYKNTCLANDANKLTSFSEFTITENSGFALPIIFKDFQILSGIYTFTTFTDHLADTYEISLIKDNGESVYIPINSLKTLSGNIYSYTIPVETRCIYTRAILNHTETDRTSLICLNNNSDNLTSPYIYPNPTRGKIYIGVTDLIKSIDIYSVNGNLLGTVPVHAESGQIQADISNLPAGIYFIGGWNNNKYFRSRLVIL